MKFSSYQEAYQVAKETDNKLSAYDFHPYNLVEIIHEEGTSFHFKSSFLREWKDYIFVFTEHHGIHVYHRSDLYSYGEYKSVEDKKLENTGHLDKCEFCEKEFKVENLEYNHHPDYSQYDNMEYYSFCADCKDVENCEYTNLWKDLNKQERWDFVWGKDNIEHIKKACATVMNPDYVEIWLDTQSEDFPKTPRKVIEEDYEQVYLAIFLKFLLY